MKRKVIIIFFTFILIILSTFFLSNNYAANKNSSNQNVNNQTDNNQSTNSKLIELKEKELNSLEDYKNTYGSDSYGLTAYILHKVQIYSIPFCFFGIILGAINQYVIGVRHLEANEKGLAIMVGSITLGVICQVLPLVFTIVVKFGRE